VDDKKNKDEESIEALGGVLPDGRTVDVIRDVATGRLSLVWFDGKEYHAEERISIKGRTFVPPALDPAFQTAVTLPTKALDHGCTENLFRAILDVLTEFGMSLVATVVTYFLFSDWFPEPSLPAPCLIITGPGAEAALLLQLLACLVRRGLPMVEIGSHGFRGLMQQFHPTVLLDARHYSSRSLRKLLAPCGSRVFAPWKGSVAEFSCAKVVYVGPTLVEDVPTDFALRAHLSPSPRGVSLLDGKRRDRIIATLLPQLIDYRLRNLVAIRASDFDLPDLDLEGRIIAQFLGRCIKGARQIQAGARSLIEGRDEELRSARWTDPVCAIIEALLDECHSPQPDGIYVGTVAEAATALLKARGVSTQLKARAVGSVLRGQLGFRPKRNGKGSRILLSNKVLRMVHGLARDYRVAAVEDGIARCAVCRDTFTTPNATDGKADFHGEQSP
jgi:hypothetical protein